MAAFDLGATAAALDGLRVGDVTIEASNISGSPYRYVYLYLTRDRQDGPYVLVSDRREYEDEDGYLVGYYEDWTDEPGVLDLPTLDEVRTYVRRCLKAQG